MADGDLHDEILRLEAQIEELTEAIDRCRKIILVSKIAVAAGGNMAVGLHARRKRVGARRLDPRKPRHLSSLSPKRKRVNCLEKPAECSE
jgi:hypothetical protein